MVMERINQMRMIHERVLIPINQAMDVHNDQLLYDQYRYHICHQHEFLSEIF